jgi:hypothetical protein
MVNQTNTKQTVQMIEQAMLRLNAELDVLTAVHQSLNGNHIDLRLYV